MHIPTTKPAFALAARLSCVGLVLALGACSSLEKVEYKSTVKTTPLEIPPDLTQLARDPRYAVSGGSSVSAAGVQQAQAAVSAAPVAAQNLGDARIERSGNQRWLVVKRSPEQLWGPLRAFWTEGGFVLTQDQANLGIMETDWAENRAKIPDDFIRGALGRALDALYSTGERDKFRTRLERTADGSTEIYISHRGMVEVYAADDKSKTVWQPRATDTELETEFLRRLMVKLGTPQQQAQAVAAAASAPVKPAAQLTKQDNIPVLQLEEGFDRAWRRIGLSLDRTGFTVEDRNRQQGQYFVRYVDAKSATEPSFFSKLLGSTPPESAPVKYRIAVVSRGEQSTVSVLSNAGVVENSPQAERILKVLADDIK